MGASVYCPPFVFSDRTLAATAGTRPFDTRQRQPGFGQNRPLAASGRIQSHSRQRESAGRPAAVGQNPPPSGVASAVGKCAEQTPGLGTATAARRCKLLLRIRECRTNVPPGLCRLQVCSKRPECAPGRSTNWYLLGTVSCQRDESNGQTLIEHSRPNQLNPVASPSKQSPRTNPNGLYRGISPVRKTVDGIGIMVIQILVIRPSFVSNNTTASRV